MTQLVLHPRERVVGVERARIVPALAEHAVEQPDDRAAQLELEVVPGWALAVLLRHRHDLRVAVVGGVVAAGVAQVDASGERHVPPGRPHDDRLLVVRSGAPHPLVQQHLPARLVHVVAEVAVLLLAVRHLVVVAAPDQTLDDHAALGRVAEQRADRRALGTHPLVGVTAPVGEEEVVVRVERGHHVHQAGEVRRPVHVGHDGVADRPVGQPVGRVAALRGSQEPVLDPHGASSSRSP